MCICETTHRARERSESTKATCINEFQSQKSGMSKLDIDF